MTTTIHGPCFFLCHRLGILYQFYSGISELVPNSLCTKFRHSKFHACLIFPVPPV